MFTLFVVVGFLFTVVWVQRYFLNQLIEADLEHLKKMPSKPADNPPLA
ncbi:MAG: hypothetical protein ACFBSF_16805 [Leptolyngbyaceae cyanobacterium]